MEDETSNMKEEISNISKTQQLLKSSDLKPRKSLGQNFLVDSNILDKIVKVADIDRETGVIEIGPGLGALTEKLVERAGRVVAIEIDRELIALLERELGGEERLVIFNQDILQISLGRIIEQELSQFKKIKVVANLPYYITSPIIIKLLNEDLQLDSVTIMVQKEVAERLSAAPGCKEYGSLTVYVNYYAKVEIAFPVSRHVFLPMPQVDSAVIQLFPPTKRAVEPDSEETFFRILRAGFKHRRKTLYNNLQMELGGVTTREEIEQALDEAGIDGRRRAETLSLTEFIILSNEINKII